MILIKFVAKVSVIYFYACLFLGFLCSITICVSGVLKSWNIFVNSKNNFLEWLKVWRCKKFIKENYRFALFSEDIFKKALGYIENPEVRQKLNHEWEVLKHAKQ